MYRCQGLGPQRKHPHLTGGGYVLTIGCQAFNGAHRCNHGVVFFSRQRYIASQAASAASQEQPSKEIPTNGTPVTATVSLVSSEGSQSPLRATWMEVLHHIGTQVGWADSRVRVHVYSDEEIAQASDDVIRSLVESQVVIATSVNNEQAAKRLAAATTGASVLLTFDCCPTLQAAAHVASYYPHVPPTWITSINELLPARDRDTWQELSQYWRRASSDDMLYTILLAVSMYVTPVQVIQNTKRQLTLPALVCMASNCREQVVGCLSDPKCKECLDRLNSYPVTDQVAQYQCVVSYESPELEQFSLYVLQKYNCMGNTAEIPALPHVDPMTTWRGAELTWESAEDIFVGWLREDQFSWRVVCGKNAAYDVFPCQYQVFYRGKAKGSMWYDPVFKVVKLDGEQVWRRRHYRVRRAKVPGTFWFSVLDNGVTSLEFWRIVDATDDLEWALFYYAGAAKAAGQAYRGAVFVTRDGKWPRDADEERIDRALESCGIKRWELYFVRNEMCEGGPLGIDTQWGKELQEGGSMLAGGN